MLWPYSSSIKYWVIGCTIDSHVFPDFFEGKDNHERWGVVELERSEIEAGGEDFCVHVLDRNSKAEAVRRKCCGISDEKPM